MLSRDDVGAGRTRRIRWLRTGGPKDQDPTWQRTLQTWLPRTRSRALRSADNTYRSAVTTANPRFVPGGWMPGMDDAWCKSARFCRALPGTPRQSLRRGGKKPISAQGSGFSKVESAHMRAFEGIYPLQHSGVAGQTRPLDHQQPEVNYLPRFERGDFP